MCPVSLDHYRVMLAAIKVQLAKIDKLSKDPLNDMSEFYEDQED